MTSKSTGFPKRAAVLLGAAAVTLVVIFGVNIFHLLDRWFAELFTFNAYVIMMYNAIGSVIFMAYMPILNRFVKKHADMAPFRKSEEKLALSRTLILYAASFAFVFVVAAALGFRFKLFYELGEQVAGVYMCSALLKYLRRILQILLSLVFLRLVDDAWTILRPQSKLPAGGVAYALFYCVVEFIVDFCTRAAAFPLNIFPFIYFGYTLVYAVFYYIGGKRVYSAFLPAILMLVL